MKHLKTFESYGKNSKEEIINLLVEKNNFRRSSLENMNEGLLDWFMKIVTNMDKGGRAKDFINEMPQKIKTLQRAKGGLSEEPTAEELSKILKLAENDGYLGKMTAKDGKLSYIASKDIKVSKSLSTH